ncbi:protein phosphatase 2C domain-containing protein [Streptomyces graminofaciens]|uniref:protein phosphatase 2C domain-containing protein n=1 Tax=Streptomyces graminofaciens TaxID=68212 RepID=UPI003D9BE66F
MSSGPSASPSSPSSSSSRSSAGSPSSAGSEGSAGSVPSSSVPHSSGRSSEEPSAPESPRGEGRSERSQSSPPPSSAPASSPSAPRSPRDEAWPKRPQSSPPLPSRPSVPPSTDPTSSPSDAPPASTPPASAPPRATNRPSAAEPPSATPRPSIPWARQADAVPPPASRSAAPGEPVSTSADGAEPSDARPPTQLDLPTLQAQEVTLVTGTQPVHVDYVGSGPPTYAAEPTALPVADPDDLGDLVADTVLDGARYGAGTLRAASVRGDSARYRGEPRRDSLLTARFGVGEQAVVLVAMATGARATPGAHRAAAEACRWIGRAVGRSHSRLVEDIRAARRGDLKSGLHRLTDRSLGKLRASAVEQGLDPEEYTASLRCLLLPADPGCRTRVFFGVGAGGLFRLRDGEWQDIEPRVAETRGAPVVGFGSLPHETPDGDRLTMDLGITTPPSPYEPAPAPPREPFRFRASVARPEDVLLLCTGGLAEPLRGEPALAEHLAERWADAEPPGLAAFLADTQVRVKGYADDRTAAAVWEA